MTPVQRKLLNAVRHYTDRGAQFNKWAQGGNERTYIALRKAGYIDSAKPFAGQFHTVTITEKGREALKCT